MSDLPGYDAWKTRAPDDNREPPAPARCEQCGADCEGTIYSPGGALAFCSDTCWRAYGADLKTQS